MEQFPTTKDIPEAEKVDSMTPSPVTQEEMEAVGVETMRAVLAACRFPKRHAMLILRDSFGWFQTTLWKRSTL